MSELLNQMSDFLKDLSKPMAFPRCNNLDEMESFEKILLDAIEFDVDEWNNDHLNHKTVNGMHSRALVIRKGEFIIGKVHAEDYIDVMVSGKVLVTSFHEDGSKDDPKELEGFNFMVGKSGRRRVFEAIEDTIWFTVDRTTKENIKDIEREISFPCMKDYRESVKMLEVSV